MKCTFKVHRVVPGDFVDGKARREKLLLHPIDPHENGVNDFANVTRSGEGKLTLTITRAEQIGKFKEGQLVTLSFDLG